MTLLDTSPILGLKLERAVFHIEVCVQASTKPVEHVGGGGIGSHHHMR